MQILATRKNVSSHLLVGKYKTLLITCENNNGIKSLVKSNKLFKVKSNYCIGNLLLVEPDKPGNIGSYIGLYHVSSFYLVFVQYQVCQYQQKSNKWSYLCSIKQRCAFTKRGLRLVNKQTKVYLIYDHLRSFNERKNTISVQLNVNCDSISSQSVSYLLNLETR